MAELQDKYPHFKNILADVKTACWTKGPAGWFSGVLIAPYKFLT